MSKSHSTSSTRPSPLAAPSAVIGLAGRAARRTARQMRRTVRGIGVPHRLKSRPGSKPGIEVADLASLPSVERDVPITCVDYGPEQLKTRQVTDLAGFLAEPQPQWARVRWINVDGLGDMQVVQTLAQHFNLHPLALEDLLHVHQRPKVESYNGADTERPRLFVITRMLQLIESRCDSEQISIFLGKRIVITFQERPGDVWSAIRERIDRPDSRLRQQDAGYLLYALLDAVVDHYFPALEHYATQLEQVEEKVLRGDREIIQQVHALRHELMLLRREMWPMRDMINVLLRETSDILSDTTRLYLRDVHDHTVQVIELAETYREVASGLADTWTDTINHRTNEAMKVLTIIATIFIPLSFFAGVFGMNFQHMPELEWKWSYPVVYPIGFWVVSLGVVVGLIAWFRWRRWL